MGSVCGKIVLEKVLNRATPYHFPHSTDVAGYAMVYGGDDRYFDNIFIGGVEGMVGTAGYNGSTTSLKEYIQRVAELEPGDIENYEKVEQPAYIAGNSYLNGACPFEKENDRLDAQEFDAQISIECREDGVYLICTLPDSFAMRIRKPQTTNTLAKVRIVDADFEKPDGSPLIVDQDFLGQDVCSGSVSGPIASLKSGKNCVKIW